MAAAAAVGIDNHLKAFDECETKVIQILDEVNTLQGSLLTREQAQLKSSDPLFQKAVEVWYQDVYAAAPYDLVFKQCMIGRGHNWYKDLNITYEKPLQ